METKRGTAGRDVLAAPIGDEPYTLIGLGGNDAYTMRLYDRITYPVPLPGVDDGEPVTKYLRDDLSEFANGGIDSVRITAAYEPVGLTGIYPKAFVSASELANIETVTLVANGRSLWDVAVDGHANTVRGSATADTIAGNAGNDSLYGGGGADKIDAGIGDDFVYGEGGDDSLTDASGNNRLYGGDGDDALTGGGGLDQLYGGDGDDVLAAGAAADRLSGGDGADRLDGGLGNDLVYGDAGDDVLTGGAGADRLYGGDGVDRVSYATAAAGVTANLTASSANTGDARGDAYNAVEGIVGSRYADVLTGNAGANRLDGGAGSDNLQGGAGADRLDGGTGLDAVQGASGNDTLIGASGAGDDLFAGGVGRDVFQFAIATRDGDFNAQILDYQDGQDRIDINSAADPYVVIVDQQGENTILDIYADVTFGGFYVSLLGSVVLENVDQGDITSADLFGATVLRDVLVF